MTKRLTYTGRVQYDRLDSLYGPPIEGFWYAGQERPDHIPAHIPARRELLVDGTISSTYGQTCEQRSGTACDLGEQCDHFAERYAETWNRPHVEKQDPLPFTVETITAEPQDVPHTHETPTDYSADTPTTTADEAKEITE